MPASRSQLPLLPSASQRSDQPARAGFEARGLIFGAPLALALKCAFVPLRKPGKLPGETISEEYSLEYGSDKIEMHTGHVREGQRVVLIDDLIATGGTLGAGIRLMGARRLGRGRLRLLCFGSAGGELTRAPCAERVKAQIVECAVVIELPDLKGRENLKGHPLFIQIEKEGL